MREIKKKQQYSNNYPSVVFRNISLYNAKFSTLHLSAATLLYQETSSPHTT